jgi:hypothetical protein
MVRLISSPTHSTTGGGMAHRGILADDGLRYGRYRNPVRELGGHVHAVLAHATEPLTAAEVRGRVADAGLVVPVRGVRAALRRLVKEGTARWLGGDPARYVIA